MRVRPQRFVEHFCFALRQGRRCSRFRVTVWWESVVVWHHYNSFDTVAMKCKAGRACPGQVLVSDCLSATELCRHMDDVFQHVDAQLRAWARKHFRVFMGTVTRTPFRTLSTFVPSATLAHGCQWCQRRFRFTCISPTKNAKNFRTSLR